LSLFPVFVLQEGDSVSEFDITKAQSLKRMEAAGQRCCLLRAASRSQRKLRGLEAEWVERMLVAVGGRGSTLV